MADETDRGAMALALTQARRGEGFVEPNPMVGAVLIRDGRILSIGHHAHFGGPHAEIMALEAAGEEAKGAVLYVTLEPCCHFGKTPPCADAIIQAGVSRVVAAVQDPFPRVNGGGFARLRRAGVEVESGLMEAEARRMLGPYLKRVTLGRPFVTAKWAMTLDGKIACANGDSRWISNERSRAMAHEIRGRMDAILIGIGTALADDPELTARPPGPRTALRVVIDAEAKLPIDGRLARTAREVPVLLAVNERAPRHRVQALADLGCEALAFPGSGRIPIPELLDELGRRGHTNLLVEGGGDVLGSFLDADQIDAVEIFVAPKLEGGPAVHSPMRGRGLERMAQAHRLAWSTWIDHDGDLRISGLLHRPWLAVEASSPGSPAIAGDLR
ncbi:MAG: bifunctional diaminohydroxyphosphoribosylaminopyrimidine deaminase/5-amino-6-(5-phosphoribosylamino)uracil reductase RibD [Isosphaeraceae bacterium]